MGTVVHHHRDADSSDQREWDEKKESRAKNQLMEWTFKQVQTEQSTTQDQCLGKLIMKQVSWSYLEFERGHLVTLLVVDEGWLRELP